MIYITYDKSTGELTGSYIQPLPPEHEDCFLEVPLEVQQSWVNYKYDIETNVLSEIEQLPDVPRRVEKVFRRQARQALMLSKDGSGVTLLSKVPSAIAAIEDETQQGLAQIFWEDSLEFYRDNTFVISIGAAIGLDEEGLDELFAFAATL